MLAWWNLVFRLEWQDKVVLLFDVLLHFANTDTFLNELYTSLQSSELRFVFRQ